MTQAVILSLSPSLTESLCSILVMKIISKLSVVIEMFMLPLRWDRVNCKTISIHPYNIYHYQYISLLSYLKSSV